MKAAGRPPAGAKFPAAMQPTVSPATSTLAISTSSPAKLTLAVLISWTLSVGSQRLLGRAPSRICHQGEAAEAARGIAARVVRATARAARVRARRLDILEIS